MADAAPGYAGVPGTGDPHAATTPSATGWAVVAMIFFWPLAIGAVLASVRGARAAGAGDDAEAARQARDVRAHGVAALVIGVARLVVIAALVVAGAGLAPHVTPALQAAVSLDDVPVPSLAPLNVPRAATQEPRATADLGDAVGFAAAKPWRILEAGDCFERTDHLDLVPLVPCARPTAFTVFYAGGAGPTWPGDGVGTEAAAQICDRVLTDLGRRPQDVPYWLWYTGEADWPSAPRLMCVAEPVAGVPDPSPAPSPEDTRSPAEGGPRHLSTTMPRSCFDAGPLLDRGSAVVELVDRCGAPHTGQVFAAEHIGVEDAEDDAAIWAAGRKICADAWVDFVGGEHTGRPLEIWPVVPEFSAWEAGARTATCVVTSHEPLTRSLEGSAGSAG